MEVIQKDNNYQSNEPSDKIIVRPIQNPFKNELKLEVQSSKSTEVEVVVLNIFGREVATWSGTSKIGVQEIIFRNTENWGEGIFVWELIEYSLQLKYSWGFTRPLRIL